MPNLLWDAKEGLPLDYQERVTWLQGPTVMISLDSYGWEKIKKNGWKADQRSSISPGQSSGHGWHPGVWTWTRSALCPLHLIWRPQTTHPPQDEEGALWKTFSQWWWWNRCCCPLSWGPRCCFSVKDLCAPQRLDYVEGYSYLRSLNQLSQACPFFISETASSTMTPPLNWSQC